MVKKSIIFWMLFLSAFISSVFAEVQTIPEGKPVTVDGKAVVGEWNDVASVEVIYKNMGKLVISIKHDGQNLNFLYQFKMGNNKTVCIPELYIDTLANGGQSWQADDWWFHVSGNDGMSKGKPNAPSRVQREFSDWKAEPNLNRPEFRSYFEFEISISFKMIDIVPGKIFGMAPAGLVVMREEGTTQRVKLLFPEDAKMEHPGTWSQWMIR